MGAADAQAMGGNILMSALPVSPDDDFDSGVGESSIFPTGPTEPTSNPEPPKPVSSSNGEVSNLDTIFAGVSPEARAAILKIVRNAGLRDDDPEIAILAAVRQHDQQLEELSKKVLQAIDEAPAKMEAAASAVSIAKSDHEQDVRAIRDVVDGLKNSQSYAEKFCRWNFGLILGGLILFMLALGVLTASWVASEKAANLTEAAKQFEENSEQTRKLQLVTHSRLLLQADENSLQNEWRRLQREWQAQGATEELQQLRARLEQWKADIDARWTEQKEKERMVLQ